MRNWRFAFVLGIAAMGVMVPVAAHPQQPTSSASKPAAKAGSSQVHSIILPQYPPDIPQGPNVETYSKNCLLCHTARYVAMQPQFSKTVWQNEVKKMVDAYGASISEADQTLIVEYLVAVKGAAAPAISTSSPK